MAIAYVNQAVSSGNETSQSSTAWPVAATINAGRLAILILALDNRSTADGQTSDVTNVTDTKGNTWTKAGEYTNTVGGAAADGATVAVWYSVITTQLTTSDTITTTYSGAVVAKGALCEVFSMGAVSTVSIAGTVQVLANDNADAGSMTISGLSSAEYLFFRAIASETDTRTMSATTASYTTTTGVLSGTGGSEKGHMAGTIEYRILTGTSSTSDPTMTDTTADRASLFIAFKENAGATQSVTVSAATACTLSVVKAPARVTSLSSAEVAVLLRQVNKSLAVTGNEVATLTKQPKRTILATATQTPSLSKQPGKVVSVASAELASVVRSPQRVVSLSSAEVPLLLKQANKVMASVSAGPIPSITKQPGKLLSATNSAAVSIVKSVLRALAVNSANVPSMTTALLVTFYDRGGLTIGSATLGTWGMGGTMFGPSSVPSGLSVSTACVISLKRVPSMLIVLTAAEAALMAKQAQLQPFSRTTTETPVVTKQAAKLVDQAASSTPSLLSQVTKIIIAVATGVPALMRQVRSVISVQNTVAVVIVKHLLRSWAVSLVSVPAVRKQPGLASFSLSQVTAPHVLAQPQVCPSVTANETPAKTIEARHLVSINAGGTPSLFRSAHRILAAASAALSFAIKSPSLSIRIDAPRENNYSAEAGSSTLGSGAIGGASWTPQAGATLAITPQVNVQPDKHISAQSTGAAILFDILLGRVLVVIAASTPTVIRKAATALLVSSVTAVQLIKSALVPMSVIAPGMPASTRQAQIYSSVTVSTAPLLERAVALVKMAISSGEPVALRNVQMAIVRTSSSIPAVLRFPLLILVAIASEIVSVRRDAGLLIASQAAGTPTVQRAIGFIIAAPAVVTASVIRSARMAISFATHALATLIKFLTRRVLTPSSVALDSDGTSQVALNSDGTTKVEMESDGTNSVRIQ